jgi:hypothetical protein
MKYNAKSLIIGRKKRKSEDDELSPCFIALFTINNPHKSGQVPDKILDFDAVETVKIIGLNSEFELTGSDIVIDNLIELDISETKNIISIKGKQK